MILIDRDLDEVAASQSSTLQRLQRRASSLDKEQIKTLSQQQLARAFALCQAHQVPAAVVNLARQRPYVM